MAIECKKAEEFLKLITHNIIYIYGAGYVADLFFDALKDKGMTSRIESFIVSKDIGKTEKYGFPIVSIDNASIVNGSVVCVAVHETLLAEIETILLKHQISNYIWIYPFLYEFSMNSYKKEEKWIDTKLFKAVSEGQYGVALRWVAIDQFYGYCKNGFELYYKGLLAFNDTKTAELRTERFRKLILNWEQNGYEPENCICTNNHYDVIDGEHRLALAIYHRIKSLKCIVYDGDNIHRGRSIITREVLLNTNFSLDEIEQLEEVNQIIANILEEI